MELYKLFPALKMRALGRKNWRMRRWKSQWEQIARLWIEKIRRIHRATFPERRLRNNSVLPLLQIFGSRGNLAAVGGIEDQNDALRCGFG
jgi:hypothetical protein